MLLRLAYYGDPFLRRKAQPVEQITEEIKTLVESMVETMRTNNGCGLAATQVYQNLRIFVISVDEPGPNNTWTPGPVHVFINPKLSHPGDKLVVMGEGCLSIPSLYEDIERPNSITVEAMNLNGEIFTHHYTGLLARIIMHENDHINGVLFVDRLNKKDRQRIEPKLREIKKRYSTHT